MNLNIGSGDIHSIMMGENTKGFKDFMRKKFLADEVPYYNALASPIDALRTGSILEDRYLNILPDNYFPQYKIICNEMDVFSSTLDFAIIEKGFLVDFEELKTIHIGDFVEYIHPLKFAVEYIWLEEIKKKFKNYYYQIQAQLMCTGLNSAKLVFLMVDSYDDDVNYHREIKENDYVKFRIKRDEDVISLIKEKGRIFQEIKDFFTKSSAYEIIL